MKIADLQPLAARPDYAAEYQRLVELQLNAAAEEKNLQAIAAGLHADDSLDAAANALIASGGHDRADKGALRKQQAVVAENLRVLRRAIEIQRDRVGKIAAAATLEVTTALQPAHAEMAKRMAAAAIALATISDEEIDLIDAVRTAGYSLGVLNPVRPNWTGRLSEDSSKIRGWLRAVEKALHLPEGKLYAPSRFWRA